MIRKQLMSCNRFVISMWWVPVAEVQSECARQADAFSPVARRWMDRHLIAAGLDELPEVSVPEGATLAVELHWLQQFLLVVCEILAGGSVSNMFFDFLYFPTSRF